MDHTVSLTTSRLVVVVGKEPQAIFKEMGVAGYKVLLIKLYL